MHFSRYQPWHRQRGMERRRRQFLKFPGLASNGVDNVPPLVGVGDEGRMNTVRASPPRFHIDLGGCRSRGRDGVGSFVGVGCIVHV